MACHRKVTGFFAYAGRDDLIPPFLRNHFLRAAIGRPYKF